MPYNLSFFIISSYTCNNNRSNKRRSTAIYNNTHSMYIYIYIPTRITMTYVTRCTRNRNYPLFCANSRRVVNRFPSPKRVFHACKPFSAIPFVALNTCREYSPHLSDVRRKKNTTATKSVSIGGNTWAAHVGTRFDITGHRRVIINLTYLV